MKNWKRLIATGLVASVALLGAACGDDAEETGTDTETGVTSTETAPAGGTETSTPTETES